MFTNLNLTDMEVCYKVFRKSVLDRITIKCNRFGFEPEITAKIAKLRPRLRILRSRRRVLRAKLRRRQKDHLEGRGEGDSDDHPFQVFGLAAFPWITRRGIQHIFGTSLNAKYTPQFDARSATSPGRPQRFSL